MVRCRWGAAAGPPVAAASAAADGRLSARELRDLRAVLRVVRADGHHAAVRIRHVEVELAPHAPQHFRQHDAGSRRAPQRAAAASKSDSKRVRQRRRHCSNAESSADAPAACVNHQAPVAQCSADAADAHAPGERRHRRRGPAAEARSRARLLAYNHSKRQRMLAESKLRVNLNLIMKRMRYERMWCVKRAHAEGRRVNPSLSEAIAPFLSASVTQHPPQEVAGTKRVATSDPISPPSSALLPQFESPAVVMIAERVKPSPAKRSRGRKCKVCGYMPFTCTCKKFQLT